VTEANQPVPSPERAAKLAFHKFQRIAVFAATAGFAASTILIFLKLAADRLAPANAQLHSSFEAACALLWPSAVILLGAQTFHGGLVLFLLSAVLNAGYFVFASMFFAAVFDKTQSRAQVLAPVPVTGRSASHRSAAQRPTSSRSVA
jgi:hypothetical protein